MKVLIGYQMMNNGHAGTYADLPRTFTKPVGSGTIVCDGLDSQTSSAVPAYSAGDGEIAYQAYQTEDFTAQSVAILDALLAIPTGDYET